MKIADGLEIIQLSTLSTGREGIINPVLIWDEASAVLVDTGLPDQASSIIEKIEAVGVPAERLTKIIITHHDLDHIGSLSDLRSKLSDHVQIISHSEEKPYIEFEEKPLKMSSQKAEELMPMLKSKVDMAISHGDELSDCGGIVLIHTPGHTPGHISLYLKKYKILISGDALNIVDGELLGPHPRLSDNFPQAKQSLKCLLEYDIKSVICYHGGVFNENVRERILQLSD